METKLSILFALVLLAGCASRPADNEARNPPMRPGGPDWAAVDKTVQRIKEGEKNKPVMVETSRTQEQGFLKMSDEDYAAVLAAAREDIKRKNPDISESELERQATACADEKKRQYEASYRSRASSTFEWKKESSE